MGEQGSTVRECVPITNEKECNIIPDETPFIPNQIIAHAEKEDLEGEQVLNFCSVLQECKDKNSIHIFQSIHRILMENKFNIETLRTIAPTSKHCRSVVRTKFDSQLKEDGFRKESVHFNNGVRMNTGIVYLKDYRMYKETNHFLHPGRY